MCFSFKNVKAYQVLSYSQHFPPLVNNHKLLLAPHICLPNLLCRNLMVQVEKKKLEISETMVIYCCHKPTWGSFYYRDT